jgi:predicted DNA-binding protein
MTTEVRKKRGPKFKEDSLRCRQDVRMDNELHDRLSAAAKRRGLTNSEYVRQILADHLERSFKQ